MKGLITSIIFVSLLLSAVNCNRSMDDILSPLFEAPASSRPRIISSNPSEIGGAYNPSLPLYVDFDRTMDAFSTERAFSVSGAGTSTGEFRWVGNRLIYDLKEPLKPGIAFIMRVSGSAKSQNNAPMETEFIVHFLSGSTIEAPVVLSNTPALNAQAVRPDSDILLVFSRSMNRQSVEESFTINPATNGIFSWSSDDTIMTFQSYSDLQTPARYSIGLGTSAADKEGITLNAPLSFSFQTGDDLIRPAVQEIREQGAITVLSDGYDGVQKESPFVITFSEPMNPAETEKAISLIRRYDGAAVAVQTFWSPAFSSVTVQPKTDLLPETDYSLTVSTAAKDQSSNALLTTYRTDFKVSNAAGAINSDYLRLLETTKTHPGSSQTLDPSPDITTVLTIPGSDLSTSGNAGSDARIILIFSHSLDPATLPESFSISKVLGSHPASGRILGINLLDNGATPASSIQLTIGGLGAGNEYRLRMAGGKSSNNRTVHSTEQSGEHSTFMKDDIILNFRVENMP